MQIVRAIVFGIMHSAIGEALLYAYNFYQTMDIMQTMTITGNILFWNTIWSTFFLAVFMAGGHGNTTVKIILAPLISSLFVCLTLNAVGVSTGVDFLTLFALLFVAGLITIVLLWDYRRSYQS